MRARRRAATHHRRDAQRARASRSTCARRRSRRAHALTVEVDGQVVHARSARGARRTCCSCAATAAAGASAYRRSASERAREEAGQLGPDHRRVLRRDRPRVRHGRCRRRPQRCKQAAERGAQGWPLWLWRVQQQVRRRHRGHRRADAQPSPRAVRDARQQRRARAHRGAAADPRRCATRSCSARSASRARASARKFIYPNPLAPRPLRDRAGGADGRRGARAATSCPTSCPTTSSTTRARPRQPPAADRSIARTARGDGLLRPPLAAARDRRRRRLAREWCRRRARSGVAYEEEHRAAGADANEALHACGVAGPRPRLRRGRRAAAAAAAAGYAAAPPHRPVRCGGAHPGGPGGAPDRPARCRASRTTARRSRSRPGSSTRPRAGRSATTRAASRSCARSASSSAPTRARCPRPCPRRSS